MEALAKFMSEECKSGFSIANLLLILAITHVRAKC